MRFGLGLMVTILIGGCTSAVSISSVTVRDAQFDVVKDLSPAELSEFHRHWKNRQVVEIALSDVGGQHFKFDIDHSGNHDRWLYQTTGYVQVLSKHVTPVYKVSDPEGFNRLIGAAK